MPRYPLLFLDGPSTTRSDYTNPRSGGGKPRLLIHERASHARQLRAHFEAAWQEASERSAVAHVAPSGVFLEFRSEPGCDLALKSLENIRTGIRLQNVRQSVAGDGTTITYATVFVPNPQRSHFLNKFEEFATRDNRPKSDGSTTPRHGTLVNSIGDVRRAVLESFWQDATDLLPADDPDWVEVWLNSVDRAVVERFERLCAQLEVRLGQGQLSFPERTVVLVHARRRDLIALISASDSIAELRAGRTIASFFVDLENREQSLWVDDLLRRCDFSTANDVAVLVLDHGVNNGHRLLSPLLAGHDRHASNPAWSVDDQNGHGTLMAGTAAYGDLSDHLQSSRLVAITHRLESAKILPPPPNQSAKELWGHHTAQGVALAEIQAPHRKRVICMAVTSEEDLKRGRPSSWSAEVDSLSAGYSDDKRRFFVISAGNVNEPDEWRQFPNSNVLRPIHDPAQAWNALSVGAYTDKTHIADPSLRGYSAISPAGDLSPYSSTSATWPDHKWPIKPDVLFEGGNVATGPNDSVFDSDDLKLVSTCHNPQVAQFAPFCATSAATAQASWMAARIQASYPQAWPETVRALIVHSAEWTEAQKRRFLHSATKSDYYRLAKICGYGVPSLDRAVSCATNSLTLVAQSELQPFDRLASGRYVTRDMHLYRLPWPQDALRSLGETTVKLRVTLSYFVEASPGEVGWKDRYRYASHGLRFELNGPNETEDEFVSRINRRARGDEEHPGTEGASAHWRLGQMRDVGSIHSDEWSGTAVELALSDRIAVHPTVGWWRERPHLNRWGRATRYALIVSVTTPEQTTDIYTPVASRLLATIPVPISTRA